MTDKENYLINIVANQSEDFQKGYMQAEKDMGWQTERTYELMNLQKENDELYEYINNIDLSVDNVKEYWNLKKFEYTVDDTNSLDPNSWGEMHEEYAIPMNVALEGVKGIIAENVKLKRHMEKMKCCGNCNHWSVKVGYDSKCKLDTPCSFGRHDKWEPVENLDK